MKARTVLFLLLAPILLLPGSARAYNILAMDMGGFWNDLHDQYIGAQAGYGTPGAAGERWYTMVTAEQFATVNLLDYDVLLVQSGFRDDWVLDRATAALDALAARRIDIAGFVASGRGLVGWTEPMPDGATHIWDWAPVALETSGVNHENLVHIADPLHPIMSGSSDASLSDWHSSWHGWFTQFDPRLQVVAVTGDYGLDDPRTFRPLTLAGAYTPGGCGRMVFSMQDPDYHAYQQAPNSDAAATFIGESLDWAATACEPIPEPGSLTLLGLGLAGALIRKKRNRARREPSSSE